jgi:hypothetical protein
MANFIKCVKKFIKDVKEPTKIPTKAEIIKKMEM